MHIAVANRHDGSRGGLHDGAAQGKKLNPPAFDLGVLHNLTSGQQSERAAHRMNVRIERKVAAHVQHQAAFTTDRQAAARNGQRALVGQPSRAGGAGLQAGRAQHQQACLVTDVGRGRNLHRSRLEVGQAAASATGDGSRRNGRSARNQQTAEGERSTGLGQPGRTLHLARQAAAGHFNAQRLLRRAHRTGRGEQFEAIGTQEATARNGGAAQAEHAGLESR